MRASTIVETIVAASVCFFVVSRCDRRAERHGEESDSPPPVGAAMEENAVSGNPSKRAKPNKVVRQFLRENELRQGYNKDTGLFVVVSEESSECSAPDSAGFSDVREKCLKEALKKAKATMGEDLSDSFSAEELRKLRHSRSESSSDDESGELSNSLRFSMTLAGFSRLAQAEDWNPDEIWDDDSAPGVYSVAVAVAWKQSSHERIIAESEDNAGPKDRTSADDLDTWLARQEKGLLIGPQTFKDSGGRFHYLGVGVADGDGRRAREKAERSARSFAVFPLLSKVGESMVSKTRIGSGDDEVAEDLEIVYTDELVNEGHVQFVALDDFTSVNPISGRKQTSVVVEAFP